MKRSWAMPHVWWMKQQARFSGVSARGVAEEGLEKTAVPAWRAERA